MFWRWKLFLYDFVFSLKMVFIAETCCWWLIIKRIVYILDWYLLCALKGKAVPLEAWSGPEGSRKLRFPDFMTTAQDVGKVVSLTHRPPLPPGNKPGTHFCSRLSRPQGHSATGRIMLLKNSNDNSGNRTFYVLVFLKTQWGCFA